MKEQRHRILCAVCALALVLTAVLAPAAWAADGAVEVQDTAKPTLTTDDAAEMQQADAAVTALTDSADYAAMSAADEGFERIIIFGGTGGRTEHTFANVQLLAALAKRGVKGFLADDGRTMFVSDGGTTKIAARKSGYVSVFSLDTKCEGVTLKGLKYPLSGYTLTNEFPIGVSNEFIGQTAEIIVEKGVYLVVAECSPDDFS